MFTILDNPVCRRQALLLAYAQIAIVPFIRANKLLMFCLLTRIVHIFLSGNFCTSWLRRLTWICPRVTSTTAPCKTTLISFYAFRPKWTLPTLICVSVSWIRWSR